MDRRYKKRMDSYWAKEQEKALNAVRSRDYSSWFDMWHTHPDWKSKGNRFPESRAIVARITYEVFKQAEYLASMANHPIQVFALICEDTGSNAIYLHSKNPNGTPFPYVFEDVEWGIGNLTELSGVIDQETYEIGRAQYDNEVQYIIRKMF